MTNPKITRECRQCGVVGEHYTRATGRVISPCAECQLQKQKDRQDAIRADPEKREVQRDKWARYKRRQRLAALPPDPAGATADPQVNPLKEGLDARLARRNRRRRRPPAPPETMDDGLEG